MEVKVYQLEKCSTCQKAVTWLQKRGISARFIPIKENPPTLSELKRAYARYQSWSRLFNTSGMEYRSRNLSEKIPKMSESELLALLCSSGMLVKRPFLVTPSNIAAGFKESEWDEIFANEK